MSDHSRRRRRLSRSVCASRRARTCEDLGDRGGGVPRRPWRLHEPPRGVRGQTPRGSEPPAFQLSLRLSPTRPLGQARQTMSIGSATTLPGRIYTARRNCSLPWTWRHTRLLPTDTGRAGVARTLSRTCAPKTAYPCDRPRRILGRHRHSENQRVVDERWRVKRWTTATVFKYRAGANEECCVPGCGRARSTRRGSSTSAGACVRSEQPW